MRSFVPAFELRAPANLNDTLETMAREPGAWKPFAGGTDLMVLLEAGKLSHRKFLNLAKLPELKGIAGTGNVALGALTTYTEVQTNPVLQRDFPLLCAAARETGSVATQNRGTIGGNIANASPAADTPPALLVYDAELELISTRGARRVPYQSFHTGYKKMQLAPDEIIRAIHLPQALAGWRQYYRKVGARKAQAISKVCFAGAALMEAGAVRDVRIALGSVAPVPLRCAQTEQFLRGRRLDAEVVRAAKEVLVREIAPINDIRSTARYRARVAANLLGEFISSLQ